MLVTAVAVFVGMIAGGLLPPAAHRFARPNVRWPALLAVGVGLMTLGTRVDGDTGLRMVLAGYGVLITGVCVNFHLVGMGVLLVGLGVNALVIALNGGMPVRASALVEAGMAPRADAIELTGHRVVESGDTKLAFLDDRIPLPSGAEIVSFGDLVLAVGLADATAHITRRRRKDMLAADLPDELIETAGADQPRRPAHLVGAG